MTQPTFPNHAASPDAPRASTAVLDRVAALEAQRRRQRWIWWLAIGVLIAAGGLAYFTSLDAALVFDDRSHIIERERQLRDILPLSETVNLSNRPLVSLSLAVNYAISEAITGDGLNPRSYHIFNLIVHLLAGLTLFGLVRRTIRRAAPRALWRRRADCLALAIALLWLLHPLNTQAVTYTIQRAESLAGLFYLLALYALMRSDETRRRAGWWLAAAAGACVLGGMSKLIIVSAPVVMLLYDRAVLAGSFKQAVRRRWMLYAPMALVAVAAGTWKLMATAGGEGTAGFSVPMYSSLDYALNQPAVMLHYLRLAVWPVGLTLDYGWQATREIAALLPGWMVIGALLIATGWALRYRPVLGTLGAAFFLILAPTSSIVPLADLAMEHRMYLPLAIVVALAVVTVWRVLERVAQRGAPAVGLSLMVIAAVALGVGTGARNLAYATPVSIWQDTVAKAPHNARAHRNLGSALMRANEFAAAERAFRRAIAIDFDVAESHLNLARTLRRLGRVDEAIARYRAVIRGVSMDSQVYARSLHGLGVAHAVRGEFEQARVLLQRAIEADGSYAPAHADLGNVLLEMQDRRGAIAAYQRAVMLHSTNADWHNMLGRLLAMEGEMHAALPHFQRAVTLDPSHADAQNNLRRAQRMLRH